MAITLLSSAMSKHIEWHQGLVSIFAKQNPITMYVPVIPLPENTWKYAYTREKTLPSTGYRSLNGNHTVSQAVFEDKYTQLKIFGGEFNVDIRLNQAEEIIRQLEAFTKSHAASAQEQFFDGVNADDEISGLNEICSDEGAEEVPGGIGTYANGIPVLQNSTTAEAFVYGLRDMIPNVSGEPETEGAEIPGLVWMMSSQMHNLLDRALMKIGSNVTTTKEGLMIRERTFADIPIVHITKNSSNSDILGFDETCGSNTDCGSIYLVNLDDANGVSWLAHGTDVASFDIEEPVRTRAQINYLFEVVLGVHAKKTDACRRAYGIRNATS